MNLILRIKRALESRGSPRTQCHLLVVGDAIPTSKHAMNGYPSANLRPDKPSYNHSYIVSGIASYSIFE
jgi:hypothetical protein